MEDLFLKVIDMSLTGCYVVILVILFRLLLKKYPSIFSYLLWLVVWFRLVCPNSFQTSINLIPLPMQHVGEQSQQLVLTDIDPIKMLSQFQSSSNSHANELILTPTIDLQHLLTLGWLVGGISLLFHAVFSAYKLTNSLKKATHLRDNIYESKLIRRPFIFGLFKPKIYLPVTLREDEKHYIILHEQIHLRRCDHITKIVAYAVVCLHWFNPFVWLAFNLMNEDMELSCDEAVIRHLGNNIKKNYSLSLLNLSLQKTNTPRRSIGFGENNISGRVKNIMKFKKSSRTRILFLSFITVIAAYVLLCDPIPNKVSNSSSNRSTPLDSTSLQTTKIETLNILYQSYQFTISIPETISNNISLVSNQISLKESGNYAQILLQFNKDNQLANIGTLSILTKNQYEELTKQGGPIPSQISEQEQLIIAFQGLQGPVFDENSEERLLVDQFYEQIEDTLASIKLTTIPFSETNLTKRIDFTINNASKELLIEFPKSIDNYLTLTLGDSTETYLNVLIKFEKNDKTAVLGTIGIYTQKQFELLKSEGGPIPSELFKHEDLVVTFQGLQDSVFDIETEEGQLVSDYQQNLRQMLSTIQLKNK